MKVAILNIQAFKAFLERDATAELLEVASNGWEVIRYRREECDPQGRGYGNWLWGHVYQNKKGRFTLVGEAVQDYKLFRSAEQ